MSVTDLPEAAGPARGLPRRDLLGVFLGALLLRIALLVTTAGDPVFQTPMLDAEYAVDWARSVAAGDVLGSPEGTAYFRMPLYAWFLAFAFLLPGSDLLTARVIQALLGAAACALLADVAGRRFGRAAGFATGILAGAAWPLLMFGRELLIAALVPVFGAAILRVHDGATPASRAGRWLALGLLLGLATLTRPNMLAMAPVTVVAALAWPGRRFVRVAAVVAGILIVLAPITVRNRVVSGEWVALSYQGGLNLWIGNNPEADGMSAQLPGFTSWRNEDVEAMLAREAGHPVGPREQDAHFRSLTLDFFRSEPLAAARLLARKTYLLLQGYEIRNNSDLYALRQRDPILKLPLPDFGWILPLAALGLFVHRRRWRELAPLVGYAAATAAGVIVFFVCSRYRLPAWPALLPLAGAGAAAVVTPGVGMAPRVGRVTLLAVLVVLTHVDFLGIRSPDPSITHLGYGNVWARVGDDAEAEREFREALRLQPGLGEARHHLGALLLRQDRVREALPELRAAVAAMPRSFRARRSLAEALEASGLLDEALAVRRETAALSAGQPQDVLALANALGRLRRYGEAWTLYERLLAGETAADPYLLLNAGQTALAMGRRQEGEEILQRATRRDEVRTAAWQALSRYLLSERRTDDALRTLSEAILIVPDDAELHRLRALARYARGDLTGAIEDLERVVELDPRDTASRQRLEDLRAGRGPR